VMHAAFIAYRARSPTPTPVTQAGNAGRRGCNRRVSWPPSPDLGVVDRYNMIRIIETIRFYEQALRSDPEFLENVGSGRLETIDIDQTSSLMVVRCGKQRMLS